MASSPDADPRSIGAETTTAGAGRDLTRYCAADCDLNHAGTPHPTWDCNAPEGTPTLTVEQRHTLPTAELPWVRYATPLLLTAGEVERLRSSITATMLGLQVDEDARNLPSGERLSGQLDARDASVRADVPVRLDCPDANRLRGLLGDAARRLDEVARRRATADLPSLVGLEDFTNLADQLRDWCSDLLDRQQHPLAKPDRAIAIALDAPQRQHQPAREAGHER